jgi:HAD superfamily hydrolase (TIGR01459 family)
MSGPAWSRGLRELLANHDAVLLDLWGTLHDGARLYPGAMAVLDGLAATGTPVLLLSNAPRTAAFEAQRLADMGLAPHPRRLLLTAGEIWRAAWRESGGARAAFHVGPQGNLGLFENLDLKLAETVAGAEVIVVSDLDPVCASLEAHRALLAPALARGLPLHCINPDTDAVSPAGLVPRAGAVGQLYAQMGGEVAWFGKPQRRAYDAALTALGDPPPERVLAVGDKIATDIMGAHDAGLSCALVVSGLEGQRLGLKGEAGDLARLAPRLPPECSVLATLCW